MVSPEIIDSCDDMIAPWQLVSIGEIELSDPNRPNLNKTGRGQGIEVSLEQDFQS